MRITNGNLQNQITTLNEKITSAEKQIDTLQKSYLIITKRVVYYE
jgi:peptidoglycan hydrolase CwlO-like protein